MEDKESRRKTSLGARGTLWGAVLLHLPEQLRGCRMAQVHRPHHEPHAPGVDNHGLCQLPMRYMVYPYVGVPGLDLGLGGLIINK
jgi:hypothetical protein